MIRTISSKPKLIRVLGLIIGSFILFNLIYTFYTSSTDSTNVKAYLANQLEERNRQLENKQQEIDSLQRQLQLLQVQEPGYKINQPTEQQKTTHQPVDKIKAYSDRIAALENPSNFTQPEGYPISTQLVSPRLKDPSLDSSIQCFLTYYNYVKYYSDVDVHPSIGAPHRYQQSEFEYLVPTPNPSFGKVSKSADILMEMAAIELTRTSNFDEATKRQLDTLEIKKIEGKNMEEFQKEEKQENELKALQEKLNLVEIPPFFQLPLPVAHPQPLIPAPYLFLHIPKTGGNSIHSLFQHTFKSHATQHWTSPDYGESYTKIIGKKSIVGHFNYGLHFYLQEAGINQHSYLTLLRDPVDRVISHYYYHRERKEDEGHALAINSTIEEWTDTPRGQNEQTRVLSGITSYTEDFPSMESFRMALSHLRKMKFVGLTERYEETAILMKYYCGLNSVSITQANKRKDRTMDSKVSQDVRMLIKEKNWMDVYLYEEAVKMFERQLDIVGRDIVKSEMKKKI
ncbi:hypothetical protein DFA_01258 [Cavenderia fasciculata]|uniref:Uncharacterized protein n=1 Tax=Cavenderia fasciculata TaxID=261658 RepID=F4PRU1_CACFS|nr:uncharacterized protein DFA_01258 [Cavenderia fasciculata]EGG21377.1 hypothetical protein DFA_01258 [Cavenderia fasciculata]|eukprot:XP_004359227.1 hypothetical protein DFA_01258 [Cavenderia fasciculata]